MPRKSDSLPSNVEAERLILGAILVDEGAIIEVEPLLSEQDFSLEQNRLIYRAIVDLRRRMESVTYVTVAEELKRKGKLEDCGGYSYLVSLGDGVPKISAIRSYARIVREKSILRQTIEACNKTIKECYQAGDDASEIVARGEAILRELRTRQSENTVGPKSAEEIVTGIDGGLDRILMPPRDQDVARFPWEDVDRIIPGMRPGELLLLAARPSVGKSAAAMQIAEYNASRGKTVVVFSLEMSIGSILQRMVCAKSGIELYQMRHGHLTETERYLSQKTLSEICSYPLYFDESHSVTTTAIYAALKRLQDTGKKIGLVVIDYLQLMRGSGRRENRNQEMSEVSRGLKLISVDFQTPILALSQLTRDPERERRRPLLSDLRDSGSIEQDSDVVMFLHWPQSSKRVVGGASTEVEFIVGKHRNGPVGRTYLFFNAPYCRFERSRKDEEEKAAPVTESVPEPEPEKALKPVRFRISREED